MRFRLPLLVAVATLFFASFAQAENCTSAVLDKAGVIRGTALIAAEARPLINQGADVRIVTVDHNTFVNNGSSLTGVETYLETSCPNWTTNGVRKANLFVVMVAPQDRQKNIFLGSYYAGSFDIPSTYSALANGNFKAGQWEIGIASTLHGAGPRAIAFHQHNFTQQQQARTAAPVYTPPTRAYTPTPTYTTPATPQTADSSGVSGFTIFLIVVVILLLVAAVLYFLFRESETTPTTTYSSDAGFQPTGGSGVRQRSYGAAAPSSTTVIHEHYDNSPRYDSSGNLITGILLGEALSRPSQPSVVYEPAPSAPVGGYDVQPSAPSYTPDPAPVADAPDSSWEEPTQQADTNFESPSVDTPSFDPPSSDFGSSGDSGF